MTETNAVAWLSQPGIPRPVPVANLPGMAPFVDGSAKGTSPELGQHTREVLREHGFEEAKIDELAAQGVIGGA